MKKALFIGICALTAITLITLVSCRGQSGGSIDFWTIHSDGDGPGTVSRAIERFNQANPDIKVNIVIIDHPDYLNRLDAAVAAGQTPDIFFTWAGGRMQTYADNNIIADLTDYMAVDNFKDKFLDAAIANVSYNGRLWGVPVIDVAVGTMFYNKEIFEQFNLSPPSTISELEAICDILAANGIAPFLLGNRSAWPGNIYYSYLATRRGGLEPFANAVNGTGTFLDPAFIFAGEKIQEWVRKGYFIEGFNDLAWETYNAHRIYYRGEAAMLLMGSWWIMQAQHGNPDFVPKMGAFKFPRDENGTGDPNTIVGTIGDNFFHVSASSKNPAKAFEFLTVLMDEQGIQDMQADGRLPPVKGITVPNPLLPDPLRAEITSWLDDSPEVQLWYENVLTPEPAGVYLEVLRSLYGLTMTPAEAAQTIQDAQTAWLESRR